MDDPGPAAIASDDPRWDATLEYTTDDDGIWLVYGERIGGQRINLGFWPSARDVVDAIERLAR